MYSTFIIEQKRYTVQELQKILYCDDSNIIEKIKVLKEYGILKIVPATSEQKELSDLIDADIEITSAKLSSDNFYVFTYVGIVTIGDCILKCLPKYIEGENSDNNTLHLKLILQILDKYNKSKSQIISMYNDTDNGGTVNKLAIIIYLLQDYIENGIYTNIENTIENNGLGEIIWDKTINETFAIIANGKPYYLDLKTKKKINNETDYFKRLHEAILTDCSNILKYNQLSELFDFPELFLTDAMIDDFGDRDYILYRISNELNTQFNNRKIRLLKTLYCFVSEDKSFNDINCFNMYGSNNFNDVWEKVCASILDNKLHTLLKDIELPTPLKPEYEEKKNNELINIIDKPIWTTKDNELPIGSPETLRPDIISIKDDYFIIFDAKYYKIILENNKKLSGNPGIADITKQYLYQLAYQDFILKHGFKHIYNCFLMPSNNHEKEVEYIGEVKLEMITDKLNLEIIKVFKLSAEKIYNDYLSNKYIDLSLFFYDIY